MFGSLRAPKLFTLLSAFVVCGVQALPKISRTGRYLYDESGIRFYIKGIAYQPQGTVVQSADNHFGEPSSFIDPLALPDGCSRDIPFLQQLGVNTIRVYSVDSTLNHDSCMKALSAAGIYTIIDLSLPLNGSIDRTVPTWSTNVLDQYTRTIDVFSKYDNVLAYNVGNEAVVGDHPATAAFVKAAARDTKSYVKSKSITTLLGYAAIDASSTVREPLANYLSCDPSGSNSDSTSIDLYGLNNYEWCGDSSFQSSYAGVTSSFANYNVAAYFSEYGCIKPRPRVWTEASALFTSDMTSVWSGGIAFSYFPATSSPGDFGIVTISSDEKTVTVSDEFNNLKTEYGKATFINSPSKGSSSSTYGSCPAQINSTNVATTLPPTPNEAACNCLLSTLSCRFTPATANYSAIVGEVINNGCSLLGSAGGSCADISSDGSTGTYGRVAGCDPTIKASFVMSEYYEATKRNQQSCSFAGNGTVNPNAPTSASAADSAASSCIKDPSAIFTPSSAPSSKGGSGGSSGSGSGTSKGAAVSLLEGSHALFGLGMTAGVTLLGAVWTLA